MPGELNPFDSYNQRLADVLNKATDKQAEAQKEADTQQAGSPFDSFAGRLDTALKDARGEAAPPTPPAPSASAPAPAAYDSDPTGPVGEGEYVVKLGDCMESIAAEHGFFWESLWDDPANSQLREARKNPNVLLVGDQVAIREKQRKEEPGETEQVHRFRRKGMPSRLQLRYFKRGEPRAGESYTVVVDGKRHNGELDANGRLDIPIPPDARRARVRIGDDSREQQLVLGSTDPVSEISGVQCRLNNLGFDAGPNDNVLGPRTEKALREFQERHELEITGKPDSPTRQKLVELNGS